MRIFRSQRLEKGIRSTAIFLAVVLAYFSLRAIPPVRTVLGYAEHGLVVVGTGIGTLIGRVFANSDAVSTARDVCEERLRTVTEREAALRQELRDVTELEQLLGYVRENATHAVAAKILVRSLPHEGTVTIDKGTEDGVTEGSAVVVGDGQLFGTVVQADAQSARVRLVQEKESNIPAAILGSTRTIGLVQGQNGSVLHMEYIPSDAAIAVGDLVVTSGLDGGLPPHIVVGLVTSVVHEDTAPFLQALIEPLYDAREWTNVLVLTSSS